jgi:Mg-chelatase subunit ChlD
MRDNELAAAQRICEAVAQTGLSSDLWAAIVTAADAWSEYQRLCDAIHALSVVISDSQWAALMGGVA